MRNIELKAFGTERLEEVKNIYREAGWLAYLQNDEALLRAFASSLDVTGAFDGENLIGFVRCVGDGEHIVVVQDLIVAEKYRRQGIGERLMRETMEKYRHVRMFSLYTDMNDKAANRFYQRLGFQRIDAGCMVSYMRGK